MSDDKAAQNLYLRLGSDATVHRLVRTCGLTNTTVHPHWWSLTRVSAADAALMGHCLTDPWLFGLMRSLEPSNNFGIAQAPALAGKEIAVKNGWTLHGDTWAVNCLAVWDRWSLSVLTR